MFFLPKYVQMQKQKQCCNENNFGNIGDTLPKLLFPSSTSKDHLESCFGPKTLGNIVLFSSLEAVFQNLGSPSLKVCRSGILSVPTVVYAGLFLVAEHNSEYGNRNNKPA